MVTFQSAMRKPTYDVRSFIKSAPQPAAKSAVTHCPKCHAYDQNMIADRYEWVKMIPREDGYRTVFTRKIVSTQLCGLCRIELGTQPGNSNRYTAH